MDRRAPAYAGNKIDFHFSFAAYPAGDGWSCKVVLRAVSQRQEVELTADGDAFTGSADAATTAAWAPGKYDLYVLVAKGSDRQTAHVEELTIYPDPGAETATPSALEADLIKVDAAISAVLDGQGVKNYAITTQAGQRQVQRMDLQELRTHRAWLLAKIDEERAATGLPRKRRRWRAIRNRFVS